MENDNKWTSFAQAKLEQELYRQMHIDWLNSSNNREFLYSFFKECAGEELGEKMIKNHEEKYEK